MKPVVLYGEDDANDTLLVEHAFERSGLQIDLRIVRDGACIIGWLMGIGEYADRKRFPIPELIITDSKMPLKGGLDVLRWMCSKPEFKTIPVILHYGSVFMQDLATFRDLGVIACIEKKTKAHELIECVRTVLAARIQSQQRQDAAILAAALVAPLIAATTT
jgi:CheY-like chemotaxis protein